MSQVRYKRRWRNFLLNRSYQLRFTLTTVVVSLFALSVLGWWVLRVADRATVVAENNIRSFACGEWMGAEGGSAPLNPPSTAATPDTDASNKLEDVEKEESEEPTERRRRAVVVTTEVVSDVGAETGTPLTPVADGGATATEAEELTERILACERRQETQIASLHSRRQLILWLLLMSGMVLGIGLFIGGIMMTHKVAGPLFKIGKYLDELRGGNFSTVYPLRKGDKLEEFYQQFTSAYSAVETMQKQDVEVCKRLLAAIDAGQIHVSAETVTRLKRCIDQKEASLS